MSESPRSASTGAGAAGDPAMVTAARELVAAADAAGIPVRLLGGVAIWIRASAQARAALGRDYPDIDVVAHKRQSRELRRLLEERGLVPERVFNATHGARRLMYHADGGGWHVDVFLDTFEMSHMLDLGTRLETEPVTLPAAELLLTKLQVAEINAKDLSDTAMLLWDHEPAAGDGARQVSLGRLTAVCGADWGLYTTVTDNLARAAAMLGQLSLPDAERGLIGQRASLIRQALETGPKSLGWRARAKVGRRVRWYQVPEEVVR